MSDAAPRYEIVPYRPELDREICLLQQHLWSGGPHRNRAYLEWKYARNPYLAPPLVYLALHQGRAVGMRGLYGSCWEGGPAARRLVVPCADDLVIHPAHRNRGLIGQIMRVALADVQARGYPLVLSLSAGATTMASSLADGWRSAGSMREVCRVARPASWRWRLGNRMRDWRGLWRWAPRVSHGWRRPFRHLDRLIRRPADGRGVRVTREPRPAAMADLIRRLGHDGRLRHVRDAEYFAWRLGNPLHDYRFLWAGAEPLDGYLILRAAHRPGPRGVDIVDWEAGSHATRHALLHRAIEWGRFAELSTWTMGLSPEALSLLREARFLPVSRSRLVRQGPLLLVRTVGSSPGSLGPELGGRALLAKSSWDVRMLYAMAG